MLLKVGSEGGDVKKLQSKLGLSSDGIFGKTTEAAVKSFQSKNGLLSDGIVGIQKKAPIKIRTKFRWNIRKNH